MTSNFTSICTNLSLSGIKNRLFCRKYLFVIFSLITLMLVSGCKKKNNDVSFVRRILNSEYGCVSNSWQFKYDGKWYDATVPGNIHDDLLANGLIPDPFYGDNEKLVQWVSDSVWEYRLVFDKKCGEDTDFSNFRLVFDGLDTYAEIFLNGDRLVVGQQETMTCNMFRRWKFDVTGKLKDKDNELVVKFLPTGGFDSAAATSLPYRLPDNRVFTRKAQYENGWDWGPKLNTCGIWKDVYLECWNNLIINDLYIYDKEPSMDASRPWISEVQIEIEAEKILSTEITVDINDESGYTQTVTQKVDLRQGANVVRIPVTIEKPELWWPNGLGRQHLYCFSVKGTGDAEPMVRMHGLRTVKLERKADSIGESFQFFVNGKPLFMRGFNWIPASSYPGTLARTGGSDVYEDLLKLAADANANMIRIWGGGLYEHEDFYANCDRLGLLVWQDFMFACNIYPGDRKFLDNVGIEAEEQVKRLRNHPCFAVFCGNNEVHNGLEDWGWQKQFGYSNQQYAQFYADYDNVFNKILPEKCRKHASAIPYVHTSPTFGWGHEECTTHGCSHYWGVWWGELPFEVWKEKTGRFMTEYGFQSYPEMATIGTFAGKQDQNLDSPVMKNHQKHGRGVQIISKAIEDLYGKFNPHDFGRFVYLSQLAQADGIAQAVEAHRIQHERCSGTLIWQLNDCWPVASWSTIDYLGRPKALYYKLHKLFDNVAVASQKDADGNVEIFVINDNLEKVSGKLSWKVARIADGTVVDSGCVGMNVAQNSSKSAVLIKNNYNNPGEYYILAEFEDENSNVWDYVTYFVKPKDLHFNNDQIAVRYVRNVQENGNTIVLSSKSLQKGVFIEQIGGSQVKLSDNYFDMLPNVEYEVRYDVTASSDTPKFRIISLK